MSKLKFNCIVLLLSVLTLTFCKKKDDSKSTTDSTKPTITLNGSANLEIALGVSTPDPGASATDETDGDLTSKIVSDWNSKVKIN